MSTHDVKEYKMKWITKKIFSKICLYLLLNKQLKCSVPQKGQKGYRTTVLIKTG